MGEKKERLAIFDLDGTLFDTGEVNYFAYRDALASFGFSLDHDRFVSECNGKHYTTFLPQIMNGTEHMGDVHQMKKEAYVFHLDKARENVQLFNIIRLIRQEYYTAVVTTASKKNAYDILDYYNVTQLFDLVLTAEDIDKVKPDPQGFLKAMNFFGIDGEHTVIVEDSDVGIEAANAAGASVLVAEKF